MTPEKTAGIDYGTRRIGIAVSDGLGITAQPLEQIEVNGFEDGVAKVSRILKNSGVTKAVFGLPMNMNGSEGEMAEEVKRFASKVNEECGIAVEFFDERLSSMQAESALNQAGYSKKKKRQKLDVVSAQIMLQSYMDCMKK